MQINFNCWTLSYKRSSNKVLLFFKEFIRSLSACLSSGVSSLVTKVESYLQGYLCHICNIKNKQFVIYFKYNKQQMIKNWNLFNSLIK